MIQKFRIAIAVMLVWEGYKAHVLQLAGAVVLEVFTPITNAVSRHLHKGLFSVETPGNLVFTPPLRLECPEGASTQKRHKKTQGTYCSVADERF
jgi:hypothetical protein